MHLVRELLDEIEIFRQTSGEQTCLILYYSIQKKKKKKSTCDALANTSWQIWLCQETSELSTFQTMKCVF